MCRGKGKGKERSRDGFISLELLSTLVSFPAPFLNPVETPKLLEKIRSALPGIVSDREERNREPSWEIEYSLVVEWTT